MKRDSWQAGFLGLAFVLAACGDSDTDNDLDITEDADVVSDTAEEPDVAGDTRIATDADGAPWPYPGFSATTDYERNVDYGWIAAGQPSEARLTEVVMAGARVINLRLESEDPFDEQALVESLGGEYTRYPVVSDRYSDEAFREALYDLYDRELERGGPVYLHCASSNRVGASWALYHAERRGLDPQAALALGVDAGLAGLTELVEELLGLTR